MADVQIPLPKIKKGKIGAAKAKISATRAAKSAEDSIKSLENRLEKAKLKKKATDAANIIAKDGSGMVDLGVKEDLPPTIISRLEEVKDNIVFQANAGPQSDFLAASEREVFYGGARGGGKSYALLIDPLRYCDKREARAVIIRKTMPELRDLIFKSQMLYPRAYPGAKWKEQDKVWNFPSGARIEFGYAETRADALRYQGQAYSWIGVDELPQFPTPDIWNDLRGSLRSTDPTIPIYMRSTGNPGNIGCVPYGEVWTVEEGWKDIKDVKEGELVWSVDKNKNIVQKRVLKTHSGEYTGNIVKSNTSRFRFTSTEDHRFPELIRSKKEGFLNFELRPYKELSGQATILRSANWLAKDIDLFSVDTTLYRKSRKSQPYTISGDDYAVLMGFFLSEGHHMTRDGGFGISQVKEESREAIQNFLIKVGFTYYTTEGGFSIYSKSWGNYFEQFGKSLNKYIPENLKNSSQKQLQLLLNALMLGDGTWLKNKEEISGTYYTSSKKLRDDVIEVCIKLGYKVCYRERQRQGAVIKGRKLGFCHPSYEVTFTKNKSGGTELLTGNHRYDVGTNTKRKTNVSKQNFIGQVYCLTIEDTETFFIRQDGCVWISGNSGWVKDLFISPAEPNTRFSQKVSIHTPTGIIESEVTRRFVPSTVYDNPYLLKDDNYLTMLATLPEHQRKQWLDGDWDVVESAAFSEFDRRIHVIEPFDIPHNWTRFRAADWGYSAPACCLWFAGDYDNNLYVYRELYTTKKTADEFANTVLDREEGEDIRYGVLDASAWQNRGDPGPSIAEIMTKMGCRWKPSDRTSGSRVHGKLEVHRRLALNEEGFPRLRIFSTCKNLIRTLPSLPLDKNNMEDVDTTAEDHAYDALRYGCMSRPYNPSMLLLYNNRNPSQSSAGFISDSEFGY